MKLNRSVKIVISVLLAFSMLAMGVMAAVGDQISPYWLNTRKIEIVHGYSDGNALCNIIITGYAGTSSIENVDIKLYKISGSSLSLAKRWDDLSCTGNVFEFYDEVPNVSSGYTYRLEFTADVYKDGVKETIEDYHDVEY